MLCLRWRLSTPQVTPSLQRAVFSKLVTCIHCMDIFQTNYKSKMFHKCADINASESKIISWYAKKFLFVYRCKCCKVSRNISSELASYMKDLSTNLTVVDKFNKLKNQTTSLQQPSSLIYTTVLLI